VNRKKETNREKEEKEVMGGNLKLKKL